MEEYKGKYERKPTDPDGMVDQALVDVGVKFTDRTDETAAKDAEYEAVPHRRVRKKSVLPNVAALVAADGLLIFMCLADKVELSYGLVFLAAASAILGGRVNRARL